MGKKRDQPGKPGLYHWTMRSDQKWEKREKKKRFYVVGWSVAEQQCCSAPRTFRGLSVYLTTRARFVPPSEVFWKMVKWYAVGLITLGCVTFFVAHFFPDFFPIFCRSFFRFFVALFPGFSSSFSRFFCRSFSRLLRRPHVVEFWRIKFGRIFPNSLVFDRIKFVALWQGKQPIFQKIWLPSKSNEFDPNSSLFWCATGSNSLLFDKASNPFSRRFDCRQRATNLIQILRFFFLVRNRIKFAALWQGKQPIFQKIWLPSKSNEFDPNSSLFWCATGSNSLLFDKASNPFSRRFDCRQRATNLIQILRVSRILHYQPWMAAWDSWVANLDAGTLRRAYGTSFGVKRSL